MLNIECCCRKKNNPAFYFKELNAHKNNFGFFQVLYLKIDFKIIQVRLRGDKNVRKNCKSYS